MHYLETKIQYYFDCHSKHGIGYAKYGTSFRQFGKRQLYYGGNLKRHKKLKALSQHHFIVPDCDDFGDLLQAYVFVQFVGIMLGNEFGHILICVMKKLKVCNKS